MNNTAQKNSKHSLILLLIVLVVAACIKIFGNSDSGQTTTETIAETLELETETLSETQYFVPAETIETEQQETQTAETTETEEQETETWETPETNEGSSQSQRIPEDSAASLTFRNDKLLEEHYEKHGIEMGFDSPEEYEQAAAAVVANPDALYKTEAEDGDGVYYIQDTNEFVIVSTDGYIRTYFYPNSGIAYFNRQ